MPLPVKFEQVQYYLISGKYSFSGDLVITKGVLYFFPRKDLETERIKAGSHSSGGMLGSMVATAAHGSGKGDVKLDETELWNIQNSDEQFRQKADFFITKIQEQQKTEKFSQSLPIPIRIRVSKISNMKLSFWGTFSFKAQSDNHDFNIGWTAKKRVRDALWEGGFGKL